MTDYQTFLARKSQLGGEHGFDPIWVPSFLFDFQRHLVEWALRKGCAAIFADCGLGKSIMQLVWAENVARKTNGRVIILTPLAVGAQTVAEAKKFGIEAERSRDGMLPASKIVVTNYEQLAKFEPSDFVGCVCDESSILKSFQGARRKQITRFISKMKYRLLCTATAAPNDYVELGTSSEALGELNHSEMLSRFFRQLDDKGQKKELRQQKEAESLIAADPNYFKKLAYRVAQTIGQWRLKHHAVQEFWRWVASWARACRMPSDLGFSDEGFVLPELVENDHIITPDTPPGMLFNMPAVGMGEERDERRRTIHERCEFVADLIKNEKIALVWCHMNPEGDLLEKLIPDSVQIAGRHSVDQKEEAVEWFVNGSGRRVLISKAKVFGFGLNFQHCSHVVTFATHSYEQYYQSLRRCYRFGQKNRVVVDVIATEGEIRVIGNMRRKAEKATKMFESLITEMSSATRVVRDDVYVNRMEVPSWA